MLVMVAIAANWNGLKNSATIQNDTAAKRMDLEPGAKATIRASFFGYRTEEQAGRSVELAKADKEAFKKFLGEMALSGEAVGLLPGDEVFIEGRTANNFYKIRLKGQTESWYTIESAFKP